MELPGQRVCKSAAKQGESSTVGQQPLGQLAFVGKKRLDPHLCDRPKQSPSVMHGLYKQSQADVECFEQPALRRLSLQWKRPKMRAH